MMSSDELAQLTPDKEIDARGVACPGPLLEAKRGITSVPMGGVMVVMSSDASTVADLPRWAAKMNHEYLGTIEDAGFWRLFVKRGK
jgi:tRNA 2-thiouridine synthesizing protein A